MGGVEGSICAVEYLCIVKKKYISLIEMRGKRSEREPSIPDPSSST
jgi:hypothetical protein